MMEFVKSCWQWVTENYKEVFAVLTSAQFVSLIVAIITVLKTAKKTDDNVTASETLNKTLAGTNEGLSKVDNIDMKIESANAELAKLEKSFETYKAAEAERVETLLTKVNAMLEVQSVVYSTIKDDVVRNSVNNLLINAKYAETATRAKLKQEVEELKKKVESKVSDVMEDVTKAATVIESAVGAKDDTVLRY